MPDQWSSISGEASFGQPYNVFFAVIYCLGKIRHSILAMTAIQFFLLLVPLFSLPFSA